MNNSKIIKNSLVSFLAVKRAHQELSFDLHFGQNVTYALLVLTPRFTVGMGYFLSLFVLNSSGGFAAKKHFFFVSSDHRSKGHLKFQSCLITEYAGVFLDERGDFFLKPSKTTCGDLRAV